MSVFFFCPKVFFGSMPTFAACFVDVVSKVSNSILHVCSQAALFLKRAFGQCQLSRRDSWELFPNCTTREGVVKCVFGPCQLLRLSLRVLVREWSNCSLHVCCQIALIGPFGRMFFVLRFYALAYSLPDCLPKVHFPQTLLRSLPFCAAFEPFVWGC